MIFIDKFLGYRISFLFQAVAAPICQVSLQAGLAGCLLDRQVAILDFPHRQQARLALVSQAADLLLPLHRMQ
ncbi:hypothetical protein [Pradoshia eiseniae]|uniref:hypothetical protein n=1 Tax=Pradoshia eiseniae TaxID=2064768 RepID=UPI0011B06FB9|nr:hypothetical protein [Pradoshia eiseniae]